MDTQQWKGQLIGTKEDGISTKFVKVNDEGDLKISSNATGAVAASLSDTVDLISGITKGIYLGTTGDVTVIMADGSDVTFKNLAAGVIHPISAKRIKVTGTGANLNILAIY